jgi:pimeloyl-ACP methyl ester carboxylesterase
VIVFVHGVPETAHVWEGVREAIGRESVALSLPGFGVPRPDGFGATKDDYVDWLLGQLDGIEGPIDLVGHDWGAGFTYRVATAHGDRLRSWAADAAGITHPDYEWHPFAKTWQTPGEGEAFIEAQAAQTPVDQAPAYEAMGVPHDDALAMAAGVDLTMGRCILDLYRSATPNPYADWGPWTPTSAPGLVIYPTDDPFAGDGRLSTGAADMLGARHERLEGVGHFWPYQAPAEGAALLEAFWSSL